jgi:undecaprenyl-diphosphatase
MSIFQAIVLGIVQGIGEFLPVSSSGHLVLVPWLLGWENPGISFSAVLHLGTMLAILAVFWRDALALLAAWWRSVRARRIENADERLAWLILLGTAPGAILGYLLEDYFEGLFSSPGWAGAFLIITGILLIVGERLGEQNMKLDSLSWRSALAIGLAQAGAIAPGISRSGATISAGLARGLTREEATRFSFLLAVPLTLGAGFFQLLKLLTQQGSETAYGPLAVGLVTAGLVGYLAIRFLLAYVRRRPLTLFAQYCWVAGAVSLLVATLR